MLRWSSEGHQQRPAASRHCSAGRTSCISRARSAWLVCCTEPRCPGTFRFCLQRHLQHWPSNAAHQHVCSGSRLVTGCRPQSYSHGYQSWDSRWENAADAFHHGMRSLSPGTNNRQDKFKLRLVGRTCCKLHTKCKQDHDHGRALRPKQGRCNFEHPLAISCSSVYLDWRTCGFCNAPAVGLVSACISVSRPFSSARFLEQLAQICRFLGIP
mmetsp:Transcript_101085/g.179409  ORF Transcript_101085/g.179409 Transcript_101085/m.179409 type:complete len:212 (-) Transcript_101085:320-955(-)